MEGRETITVEINATYPTNNQKLIKAEDVRAFMDIINESKFNLVDDDISSIKVNANSNTTLDQEINSINSNINSINNSINNGINSFLLPLFFVQFTVEDTNPGGGDNPTRNVTINSTNGSGVSATVGSNTVNLSFNSTGNNLRVTGGTGINISQTFCQIMIPPYSNFANRTFKVYFFRDF